MGPFHFYFVVFAHLKYFDEIRYFFRNPNFRGISSPKSQICFKKFILGGLKLTSDNVIRITKVAKSLKIKVLEDICLNYITKSIEPVKNELFKVAPRKNSDEGKFHHGTSMIHAKYN